MKKLDLIHLVIIITAIFLAYSALNSIPQLVIYLLFWITDGLQGGSILGGLVSAFLTAAFFIITASLVLKNARRWSIYIINKYDIHDAGVIRTSKHNLLYILFIGLGIYNLLQKLPLLLKNLWFSFKQQVNSGIMEDSPQKLSDLAPQIITVLLSLFLIIYAQYLAALFSDKTSAEENDNYESSNHSL